MVFPSIPPKPPAAPQLLRSATSEAPRSRVPQIPPVFRPSAPSPVLQKQAVPFAKPPQNKSAPPPARFKVQTGLVLISTPASSPSSPHTARVVQPAAARVDWKAEVAAKKAAKAAEKKIQNAAIGTAARVAAVAPAVKKYPHLAGESKGGVLTGGHLLTSMKKKFGTIWLDRLPDPNNPWHSYWTNDVDSVENYKWSTFFPSLWTEDDVTTKALIEKKVDLTHMGATMYPVVAGADTPYAKPGKAAMKRAT